MATELATFGAGCFWGVEAAFLEEDGVLDAVSGYAGGHTDSPTYRDVCTGTTNHAEVVQVAFDPERIAYDDLVRLFFSIHDPTQLNRQGPDVGTQYRSVIFTHSDGQREVAQRIRDGLDKSGQLPAPVVTQIEEAPKFFRAEEYHQRYLEKTGRPSCHRRNGLKLETL